MSENSQRKNVEQENLLKQIYGTLSNSYTDTQTQTDKARRSNSRAFTLVYKSTQNTPTHTYTHIHSNVTGHFVDEFQAIEKSFH